MLAARGLVSTAPWAAWHGACIPAAWLPAAGPCVVGTGNLHCPVLRLQEGTLRAAYMEVVTLRNSRGALLFLSPPFGDQVAPQPDVQ